ncbi:MAG: GLPGLI family protein [Bacteroidota bacterium]|nr:GLPGLI family protein [Bacteroidota bacterium]
MYQRSSGKVYNYKMFPQIIKMLLLTTMILLSTTDYAQKIEGSVRYLMTEDYVKQLASIDYLSKQAIDRSAYVYGDRGVYKSYAVLYLNDNQTKYEDSEESPNKDVSTWSYRKNEYTITRNFEKNMMRDIIDLQGKTYLIEDSIHAPKWKILNEMKEIAGHVCMNATMTDTVKKQKIVGWFALDIKNNGGPERFFGLPGLILEVNINNGGMVITADKIDLKKLTTELDLPKKIKGKKIRENDYFAKIKKLCDEKRKMEMPYFYFMRY